MAAGEPDTDLDGGVDLGGLHLADSRDLGQFLDLGLGDCVDVAEPVTVLWDPANGRGVPLRVAFAVMRVTGSKPVTSGL